MPVGTITAAKELAVTYQPLLLADFLLLDGSHLRVASHPLNVAEGGYQYGGFDWLARVMNYDITATQALSESGVDYTPQVTVTLNDTDKLIWTNYEKPKGFKGARLTLTFVFHNVGVNDFSSDSLVKFVGTCSAAQVDTDTLTITATSLLNLSQAMLPQIRVQRRCPWIFPLTQIQRQDAADDESSQFHLCGYSPDASGSNARGNLDGSSQPYKSCNYTYDNCLTRMGNGLNINIDGSSRTTGRFGGVQWSIPNTSWSRGYISGKYAEVTTTDNEAKYGDLVPLHYGEGWLDPLVLTTDGSDDNFTVMHVLLGWGLFNDVSRVIVNGTIIPHTFDDTEMAYVPAGVSNATDASKSGWWKAINNGNRDGGTASGIAFTEQPDPYGNLCVIQVVVPKKVAESSTVPRVQVLAKGPGVRVWYNTNPGGATLDSVSGKYWRSEYTENLAWILMDVLTWGNLRYRDMNISTWITYAAKCGTLINYKDQFSNTSSHMRFMASISLRQRRSVAEVVRGLRVAGKCLLYLDTTGKLAVKAKETLASQQSSAVTGSNYNTAVSSTTVEGSAASGFVAYAFDESNIAKKSDGKTPSLVITQRGLNEAPNRVTISYQDRDNRYVPDSLTIIDAEDVARLDQEITGSFQAEGINNMDQGRRVAGTWMAENYRGNSRLSALGEIIGDTGGTAQYEWDTTFKVIHLNIGDICRLNYQQYGITNQLVRIIKIQPSSNFSRVKITALHHNDAWYFDTAFQEDQPRWKPDFRNMELRPSFAWCPYHTQPMVDDSMQDRTDWTFGLSQDYSLDAAGSPLAKLTVTGKETVNVFSTDATPPFTGLQGTTATTGGTMKGGRTYWFMVCGRDSSGKLSAPSRMMTVAVPAGTNTNTVTIPVPYWPTGTANWVLFGGSTPNKLCMQSTGSGTPSSITLTAFSVSTWGVPDSEFDRRVIRVWKVMHSGVWGQVVKAVTSTTVEVPVLTSAGFTTNQWAGYDISLLAQTNADGVPLPVWNGRVDSNTAGVLTLTGSPDPTGVLNPGDVVVCRMKPTIGSDGTGNYVEDAGFINNLNPLSDPVAIVDASNTAPIVIETQGPHGLASGDVAYVELVTGNTAANGRRNVTVIDSTHYSLDSSSGNGAYAGGGTAWRMQDGLSPDGDKGLFLFAVSGTGKGMWCRIKSNTQTRYYIEGEWPVVPDSTTRFIVVEPAVQETYSEAINNDSEDANTITNVDLTNQTGRVFLVQCVTMDGGANESADSPFREIFLFGAYAPFVQVTSDYSQKVRDRNILADSTAGDIVIQLLPAAQMPSQDVTVQKVSADAYSVTIRAASGETINGVSEIVITSQFGVWIGKSA